MEQVLSQEEIDALLKGISEGDIETETDEVPQTKQVEAKVFDFASYTRGMKERLYALEFVYDRFAKSFMSALSLFIEKEVDVGLSPLQYPVYEQFVKTLPLPTNMNVVVTENLKGFFIVIFDTKLIFSVLEIVFGATTISAPRIEGREFTRIEFSVVRKLIDLVSQEMEKAWEPVHQIRCRYSRSEMNPNYITMVSKEEMVSVCDFTIEIGDIKSWMKVCVPYSILEPIKGYLIATPSREDMAMREKWFERLRGRVLEIPMELTAVLGRRQMSLQELLSLKENSILLVEKHMNDPVEIEVYGRKKLGGKVGVFKGNKAVRVEEIIQ
jgi:flagellar motor switch protein FliM